MIDVGVPKPVDSGLGELRLSGQVLSNRAAPLRVQASVSHIGPAVRRTVELYLLEKDPAP